MLTAVNINDLHYAGPELDEGQLNDLVGPAGAADLELLTELLTIYGQEANGILLAIKQAGAGEDRASLAKSLHNLAGCSSNVGLMRLSKLAVQAEGNLEELGVEALADLEGFFREEFERAVSATRKVYGLS